MVATIDTFAFAIKDRYDKAKKVEDLTLADRPLLAMMTKNEDFSGEAAHIPMIHGNPQGIAASSLADAQAAGTNVRGSKFLLTVGDYQAAVQISDKVITASRDNPGAFLRSKAAEMDGLYEQMSDNIATYMYGNSGNSLGVIASIDIAGGDSGGDRIHLTEPSQAMNFELEMLLTTATNDGSTGVDLSVDTNELVDKVNRAEGYVDIVGTLSAVAGAFLFRTGDYTPLGQFIFHGLNSFLWPDDSPPDLLGMVRAVDPTRLAGCRVPTSELAGLNIEERIQKLGSWMGGRYKTPGASHAFMNTEDWQNLQISLQSRGVRPLKDDTTRFGFLYLDVVLGSKLVRIYPDRYCPRGTFFALRLKDWTLHSMLKLLHPVSHDGLTLLRTSTKNDYEYRLISYPGICCVAPGYSGRIPLAS